MSDNAIKSVQHMWQLTSLKTLNLSSNYIKSDRLGGLQVIKELAALNMLEDLSLLENPVSYRFEDLSLHSCVLSILIPDY